MDIRSLFLDVIICIDLSLTVWDDTEPKSVEGPCCNGTLAYAAPPTIPCSSFRCCESYEDVAVYPVNHAFGYVFRCMPKNEISTRCFTEKQKVEPGPENGAIEYKPKRCCDGLKFHLNFNKSNTPLLITCIKR
ncbi:uncharacterized protein LOC133204014 [Saccostrea echinata]|uniref:uncharacterized protein LOC133204014 n=1 Tax=Saccostrea echinata TaxID=191078 RepID=UPI002A836EF4|nr:uncharacterized protein LOC133204014 [Saccostrea echinata]